MSEIKITFNWDADKKRMDSFAVYGDDAIVADFDIWAKMIAVMPASFKTLARATSLQPTPKEKGPAE